VTTVAVLAVLIVIALAGFAAYAYLRAVGIGTGGEERLAIVMGLALTLLLSPGSPTEFAAELVGLITVVLGVASVAHLAAVQLGPGRRATLAR
jgi:hypothetical protein